MVRDCISTEVEKSDCRFLDFSTSVEMLFECIPVSFDSAAFRGFAQDDSDFHLSFM